MATSVGKIRTDMGAFIRRLFGSVLIDVIQAVDSRCRRIEESLAQLYKELSAMNTTTKQALSDLTAAIAAEKTVIDGVSVLIDGSIAAQKDLSAKLGDVTKQLADGGVDVTALTDLKAQVDANAAALVADKDKLTAAVVVGTPSGATEAPPAA